MMIVESMFDSPYLFKEMAILNPSSISKIGKAVEFMRENKISAVVIGGMAVSHYVADRALTPDIDFLINDISHLKEFLTSKGIRYQALASDGAYEGIQIPDLDADFLDAQAGNVQLNQYVMKTAQTAKISGSQVEIISPSVLCIMKFCIGRQKDMNDAFKLLKVVDKAQLKADLMALKKCLTGDITAKEIWNYVQFRDTFTNV